jgi:hypothetical protein
VNAGEIAFENRRGVIAAFSKSGKPNHTGRYGFGSSFCSAFQALFWERESRPYPLVPDMCRLFKTINAINLLFHPTQSIDAFRLVS